MTEAHPRANWIWTPSLCQPLLETLLRVAAMLWSNLVAPKPTVFVVVVASGGGWWWWVIVFRHAPKPRPDPCDPIKETDPAAERSEPQEALMVVRSGPAGMDRSSGSIRATNTRSVCLSNREQRSASALELIQWINSSGERPERKRRAGELTAARSTRKRPPGPRFPRRRESSPLETRCVRSTPNPFGASGFPPAPRGHGLWHCG